MGGIFTGLLLGLTSGVTPGPLLTLVITQTFKYGFKEGLKTALSPLITDAAIVPLVLWLLSRVRGNDTVWGILSLLGALFLVYLAIENFRYRAQEQAEEDPAPRSLRKGILVNFLSPAPYIFWLTVGGNLFYTAWSKSPTHGVLFLSLFYIGLIGGKILLAFLAHHARKLLSSKGYIIVIRVLGVVLCGFALYFVWEALRYWKVWVS